MAGGTLDIFLVGFTVTLALVYLIELGLSAGGGRFATDECFHAYVAEWILAHHQLPVAFPEIYSGLPYYYPPLLHLIAAAWSGLLGPEALHVLPATFSALTLGLLLLPTPGSAPARARAWAVLLCLTSLPLAQFGVRLYVEGLSTLFMLVAVLLMLGYRHTRRMPVAWALGLVCGCAALTKLHGLLLTVFLGVLAVVCAVRRERDLARGWLAATVISIAVVLPWLIRNQVLYGSALYPAFAPDENRSLYLLFERKFGSPPLQLLARIPRVFGVPVAAAAGLGIAAALWRRRWDLRIGILALLYSYFVVLALAPLTQHRHLNPLIPVLSLVSVWVILDVVSHRTILRVLDAGLLVVATVVVLQMRDLRAFADPPSYLRPAFEEIVQRTPVNATILSLWTYDTFYYTRRPSTWPIPWGQKLPLASLFTESDPDRLLEDLDRCGIDYLLVPTHIGQVAFDAANYPQSLLYGLEALVRRGSLDIVWKGHGLALVRIPRR